MNKVTFDDIDRLVEKAQSPLDVDWLENLSGEKHNYHRLLYLLMEFMQPEVSLEIGTFYGMGAMHMGEAAKLYGGKAISIDNSTLVDYNAYKFPNQNFDFINAESCTQTTFQRVREAGKLELVFHDSYPAYMIAKMEHFLYSSLMEKGGIWIADHLYNTQASDVDQGGRNMRQFFNELDGEKKIYTDVLQQGIDQGIVIL